MSFICSIPFISLLFISCAEPLPLATGYVEGEYVLIAPVTTAQVRELTIRRGDRVEADQILVIMEKRDAEIALAEAEAALAQSQSQLENLHEGRRPDEIRVIEAALQSAEAEADVAKKDADRQRNLLERGIAPQAQADDAITRLNVAQARVAEAEASLAVAKLPARPHEIKAAESDVTRLSARRDAAAWQLEQRTLRAPSPGTVYEILREFGELAGAQAPVLSLLPDGAVLLRLYVPEPAIAGITPGTRLTVNCDGCGSGNHATVSYVSDSPEFTPPVIYSLENRQKLVYLVEARPDPDAESLKPGQIVDVVLDTTQ